MLNTNIKKLLSVKNLLKFNKVSSNLRNCSSNEKLNKTALYDFHAENGAKFINFSGYLLPVTYADQSVTESHLYTRQVASLFDVSHMQQTYLRGKNVIECFESICTSDLETTPAGSSVLTVFTNDNGGILDDLIVTKLNDNTLYVVSNAAMKQQDMQIIESAVSKYKGAGKDVSVEFLPSTEQSLLAIQGPKSSAILAKYLPSDVKIKELYFMNSITCDIAGIPNCRITRCGYTGEDGFEISVKSGQTRLLADKLLSCGQTKLAGLGARDTLRLEGGLCLYGADIDNSTTPIEAGLSWLIAKSRRKKLDFPGAQIIVAQLLDGVTKCRVGFKMIGDHKPPARADVGVYNNEDLIGKITSGCPSPSLKTNICMGYISSDHKHIGNIVNLRIRNKFYEAEVSKMPFVKTNYYVKSKANSKN